MNNFIDKLMDRLEELYKIYEGYIWHHPDVKLSILFQENTITFYLYDDNNLYDELIFSFHDNEKVLYRIICLKLFEIALGYVMVHNDNGNYYNKNHKPYLNVVVADEDINKLFDLVINEDRFIDISNISIHAYSRFKSNKKFIQALDNRIEMTRKSLKR